MSIRVPNVEFHGPVATHDQACAVCVQRPAVLEMDTGIFKPCWTCQDEGWTLTRLGRLKRKLRRR